MSTCPSVCLPVNIPSNASVDDVLQRWRHTYRPSGRLGCLLSTCASGFLWLVVKIEPAVVMSCCCRFVVFQNACELFSVTTTQTTSPVARGSDTNTLE